MASPGIASSADLLALIQNERNKTADAVPPGFKSVHVLADEWGITSRRAHDLLLEGWRAGVLDRVMLRIVHGGQMRQMPHYRKKG